MSATARTTRDESVLGAGVRLRQRAVVPNLRRAYGPPPEVFVGIAGTWSLRAAWQHDLESEFQRVARACGFQSATDLSGQCFNWYPALPIPYFENLDKWLVGADNALYFVSNLILARVRFHLIGHSNGGQVAQLLAHRIAKIPETTLAHDGRPLGQVRVASLTTIATPPRADVPVPTNIDYWQHIYDADADHLGGFWGQLGERVLGPKARSFDVPGVVNIAVHGIGHSGVLRDPGQIAYWRDRGWWDRIRRATTPQEAA